MPTIRETITTRIADLGLTAYTAAARTDGAISGEQVDRYLKGARDLRTASLDPLLTALGLAISPAKSERKNKSRKSAPVH